MVVNLGLHTQELLYETYNNIAEILSEKAECFEEVANHSQRALTLINHINYWSFLTFMTLHIKKIRHF